MKNSIIKDRQTTKASNLVILLSWFCRVCVGIVFIFSGFVKAIDPYGTIYKITEYLNVLNFDALGALSVPLTFILFSFEFLVGIFVLFGCYRRLSIVGALLVMFVMLPLTFWIALKNPVSDCGCFGDALVLTNWQTFWKNVVLVMMCVYLLLNTLKIPPLIHPSIQWITFICSLIYILIIGFIGYNNQPLIDFRPYQVGTSLFDSGTDEEEGMYMAKWTNGVDVITIPADSIPDGIGWEFVDRIKNEEIIPDKKSNQLSVFDIEGNDVTEELANLYSNQLIVLFYPSLKNVSTSTFYKINSLNDYCNKNDIDLIAIASSTPQFIDEFRGISLAEYPIYISDDTLIKEVVRGNPGVIYVDHGKIEWKTSLSALDVTDFLSDKVSEDPKSFKRTDYKFLINLSLIFTGVIIPLVLLSHIPKVVAFAIKKNKGKFVKNLSMVGISILCLTSCQPDADEPLTESQDTAILVYMVASNNLYEDAYMDLDEILQGVREANKVSSSVYVYINIYNHSPSLFKIEKNLSNKYAYKLIKTYSPEEYSVSANRLSDVINDFKNICNAKHYGLFLWSHATSWVYTPNIAGSSESHSFSFGLDYGKGINIDVLSAAIPDYYFDFIWMDCCYMGSIEVACQMRDKCRYYISYPTEVMAEGAPYNKILPILLKSEFHVVPAAQKMYDYYNGESRYKACTISVINTSFIGDLIDNTKKILSVTRYVVDKSSFQQYGSSSGIVFYDFAQYIHHYANHIGHGNLIESFDTALASTIIYKAATPSFNSIKINNDMYSGLSCHIPNFSSEMNNEMESYYRTLDWWKMVYE